MLQRISPSNNCRARRAHEDSSRFLSNPYLWILVVTGAGLLGAYAFALNGIRLHVAYTFVTSGALVVLALVSAVLLGQTINALNWLGIVLIVVGIVLVSN